MQWVRRWTNPSTLAQAHIHNAQAQQLYIENFSHRTPMVEREISLGELQETILPHIF